MTEGAQNRLGFSAIGGREAKAKNIVAILAAAGHPLKPAQAVRDLDCGRGVISDRVIDDAAGPAAHPREFRHTLCQPARYASNPSPTVAGVPRAR